MHAYMDPLRVQEHRPNFILETRFPLASK